MFDIKKNGLKTNFYRNIKEKEVEKECQVLWTYMD